MSDYKKKIGSKNPAISVIVPAYNTEKYIAECLNSVLSQTFTDFEVICVDDGSIDKSLLLFEEYAKKDSRLKVISQKNMGTVSARNTAIKNAQGEYIFPLDSDDIIAPNCLDTLYKFITTNDYAVVCPAGSFFGKKKGFIILSKPTKWNMYNGRNGIHNSSLFAKKFWEKYGGYDSLFNKGLEDFDFWLNFIDDKQKIIHLDGQCLFYYRIKSKEESRNEQANEKKIFKMLNENLIKKHPKIKIYISYNKFLKVPLKIIRFFFRCETTKQGLFRIRIFKISVFWRKIRFYK